MSTLGFEILRMHLSQKILMAKAHDNTFLAAVLGNSLLERKRWLKLHLVNNQTGDVNTKRRLFCITLEEKSDRKTIVC